VSWTPPPHRLIVALLLILIVGCAIVLALFVRVGS